MVAAVIACAPARAWDDFGHMAVAAAAWAKLTPAARERATELLKLNPQYSAWTRDVPEQDRDQIAFVRAATWPDVIKEMPDYESDGPNNGDRPPPGPEASRNIGYADHFRHKYWHFIDKPFSPHATPLQDPPAPNAQTQIAAFRAKLADPSVSAHIKSYDLVWLLHLVGDVHQPLHAASRFTRSQPNGDAGGNRVRIDCGDLCNTTNLHIFWDLLLGESEDPRDAIEAAAQLPDPDAALAAVGDEKAWIEESFELAKRDAYAAPIGVGPGPFAMMEAYKSNALEVARRRVALAGARLANLLNQALK
jgi:hypothetical protein